MHPTIRTVIAHCEDNVSDLQCSHYTRELLTISRGLLFQIEHGHAKSWNSDLVRFITLLSLAGIIPDGNTKPSVSNVLGELAISSSRDLDSVRMCINALLKLALEANDPNLAFRKMLVIFGDAGLFGPEAIELIRESRSA